MFRGALGRLHASIGCFMTRAGQAFLLFVVCAGPAGIYTLKALSVKLFHVGKVRVYVHSSVTLWRIRSREIETLIALRYFKLKGCGWLALCSARKYARWACGVCVSHAYYLSRQFTYRCFWLSCLRLKVTSVRYFESRTRINHPVLHRINDSFDRKSFLNSVELSVVS